MDREANDSTRELVEEVDRNVRVRLRNTLIAAYQDPENTRKLQDVVYEVTEAYLYNIICSTTGSINGDTFCPDRVCVPERFGDAYSVYTEWMENGDGGKIYFHLSWRDLIRMAVKNDEIIGIRINPDMGLPVILLTKQNLETITRIGDEQIGKRNAAMEEDLKKYQVWGPVKPAKKEDSEKPQI